MSDDKANKVFEGAIVDLCIMNGGTLTVPFQTVTPGVLHTHYQDDKVTFTFTPDRSMTIQ